jgi:hypothetical protein
MKAQLAVLAVFSLLAAPSLFAHHAFSSEFDMNKPMTLTGMVSRLNWTNPHATMEMKVTDPKSVASTWVIELDNTADLEKMGWNKDKIAVGDRVKVEGWVAKADAHKLGAKTVSFNGEKALSATSSFYEDSPQNTARR